MRFAPDKGLMTLADGRHKPNVMCTFQSVVPNQSYKAFFFGWGGCVVSKVESSEDVNEYQGITLELKQHILILLCILGNTFVLQH